MLTLHPKVLEKDGKKQFAVLPYDEFERMADALAEYEDLKDLRAAKRAEGDAPSKPLAKVRSELGI
jgi:PHD/YefM family antitoxin component YafN of YafNO toxin-antitoxin module